MIYSVKALKRNEDSVGEYRQAEKNKNVERSIEEQELQSVEHIEFKSGKRSDVKVTLVFPAITDKRAETEFIDRLKEIYLKKIETGAMQKEGSALEYSPTGKSVDLNNTKEEVSHE